MCNTVKISSKPSLLSKLHSLLDYRDLILLFVYKDVVTKYKQTVLGPIWIVITPLITTAVYIFVFGHVARVTTEGAPVTLFYLLSVTCWTFVAECLNKSSTFLVDNQDLFAKVYFPRLVIPISIVISALIQFLIRFVIFLVIFAYYVGFHEQPMPKLDAFFLPLIMLIFSLFALGVGLFLASLTTKYRDFRQVINLGIQLLMFGTPVVYPLAAVSDNLKKILENNPLSALFEYVRAAFLNTGDTAMVPVGFAFISAIIILILGLLLFDRVESKFVDTI